MPLSLQLLFPELIGITSASLTHLLRTLHPSLAEVRVEVFTGALLPGKDEVVQMAQVSWGRHRVQAVFVNTPLPPKLVKEIVDLAHYEDELKAQARAHISHAVLLYRGEEVDPLEQYIALAMIAVGLTPLGAVVVANASAYTSYPAAPLLPLPGEDLNQLLRNLPLTALFVGFVRLEIDGQEGVWMRTCGAPLLGLPDLAWRAASPDEGTEVFHRFNGMLHTMRDAGVSLGEGDMVEDGARQWTLRKPRANEGFLSSPRMLVLEELAS